MNQEFPPYGGQSPYSGQPPTSQPYSGPSVPLEVAYELQAATAANIQLQQQLTQKIQAGQALTEVYKDWEDNLFVVGKSGEHIRILNHAVESVLHVIPTPPFRSIEVYIIWLKNFPEPLYLTVREYENDRKLLAALQELPGVRVTFVYRSMKTTLNLLRSAFSSQMETVRPNFYGAGDGAKNTGFNSGDFRMERPTSVRMGLRMRKVFQRFRRLLPPFRQTGSGRFSKRYEIHLYAFYCFFGFIPLHFTPCFRCLGRRSKWRFASFQQIPMSCHF